jgi:hypothetical protein
VAGEPALGELLGQTVYHHGAGSWLPLPPPRTGRCQNCAPAAAWGVFHDRRTETEAEGDRIG